MQLLRLCNSQRERNSTEGREGAQSVCLYMCAWMCASVAQLQQRDKIAASVTALLHNSCPTCSNAPPVQVVCARVCSYAIMWVNTVVTDFLERGILACMDNFEVSRRGLSYFLTRADTHTSPQTHHKDVGFHGSLCLDFYSRLKICQADCVWESLATNQCTSDCWNSIFRCFMVLGSVVPDTGESRGPSRIITHRLDTHHRHAAAPYVTATC